MKIALVMNDSWDAWLFRRQLIEALIARGIEVVIVAPEGPCIPKLLQLGAKHIEVPVYRFVSPWRDLKLCINLYRVFRRERFDIVHTMTVKPNTYGALAAWLAGVPTIVGLAAGLGYGFMENPGGLKLKQRLLRTMVSWLYKLAGKAITRMWFLNEQDLTLFVESGFLRREKAVLILSEGVDLQQFSPQSVDPTTMNKLRAELGLEPATLVVLMVAARVVWSKGVKEFVEASRLAQQWARPVKFLLVGPSDPNSPDPVPEEYLQTTSCFKWLGFRSDVKDLVALTDVVTLPSFYREGVPMVLLEGMAMGKPIVTTDNVGCRETVDEGQNGFLVAVRNTEAFASAVKKLVEDDTLRSSFGRHSEDKVRKEFDKAIIVNRVLKELYCLDNISSVKRSPDMVPARTC